MVSISLNPKPPFISTYQHIISHGGNIELPPKFARIIGNDDLEILYEKVYGYDFLTIIPADQINGNGRRIDRQRRMTLSKEDLIYLGTEEGRYVYIIGCGNFFEIWDVYTFERYFSERLSKIGRQIFRILS